MRKKSMYESYVRFHQEAITLTIVALALTLTCLLGSYYIYRKTTRLSYMHIQGVTLQVFEVVGHEINPKNERAH